MKRLILIFLIVYVSFWSASLRIANKNTSAIADNSNNKLLTASTTTLDYNRVAHHENIASSQRSSSTPNTPSVDSTSKKGGLDCQSYGGPEDASHMMYWHDDDSNAANNYFADPPQQNKFVTFEPDEGAFNNVRMALETVIVLTIAMKRTLVLPPSQSMLFLEKHLSVFDFYSLNDVVSKLGGFEIIEMKQFLEQTNFQNTTTGAASFPPNNRTDWNGATKEEMLGFYTWLRSVSTTPNWPSKECMVTFCDTSQQQKEARNVAAQVAAMSFQERARLLGQEAAPVNGTLQQRLCDVLVHRTSLCIYDEREWQDVDIIHFKGDIASGSRLLIHFYAYTFFCDAGMDLFIKRFVRDELRYRDEIQCAAARIVERLGDDYNAMHIRRGDFKVKKSVLDAEAILANVGQDLGDNENITALYIATDERNMTFFEPFLVRFKHVYFLRDFKDLLQDVNPNFYGHVEQLVAAKSRVFFGCYFSTFTGYIQRLRGYHSTLRQAPGYEQGSLPTSFHYAPLRVKTILHQYNYMRKPIHAGEWPVSWRDIDLLG